MCVDGRPTAWADGHGTWIDWRCAAEAPYTISATPSPATAELSSLNFFASSASPNSLRPVPSTTGKIISRSSSTRPSATSAAASCCEPCTIRSPSVSSRSRGEVAVGDDGRVRPLRVLQRRGHDVLRHRVEAVGELALAARPRVREALVGPPPEQQRRRSERLLGLELVALVATVELERPRPAHEVVVPARRLHDAVERDELSHHDPAHLHLLSALLDILNIHVYQPTR